MGEVIDFQDVLLRRISSTKAVTACSPADEYLMRLKETLDLHDMEDVIKALTSYEHFEQCNAAVQDMVITYFMVSGKL